MRDLYSNIGDVLALAPAVNPPRSNGQAGDFHCAGSVAVNVNTGAIVGAGDFTVKLQESDTDVSGDFTDVAVGTLLGTIPATLAADATIKVGYIGHKRFARLVLVKTGGTSIAAGAVAVRGNLQLRPAA